MTVKEAKKLSPEETFEKIGFKKRIRNDLGITEYYKEIEINGKKEGRKMTFYTCSRYVDLSEFVFFDENGKPVCILDTSFIYAIYKEMSSYRNMDWSFSEIAGALEEQKRREKNEANN